EQVALASPTQKGVTVAVLFVTDPQASEMCQAALQTLQQLSMLYADNASVNCFPVAVDEQTVTNSVIADTLKGWGISIPYLRQPGREIMNRLGLSNVPTFLIFGTKGTLQLIEPGLLPPEDLSQFISSALAGKEPYHDILQYFQDQKTAFYQSIDACISYDVFRTDPEYVQIAERTEPQTMSLTESWRRTEFVSPGNPHVVGSSMLITHDFQKVSVLNSDGQIMELPDSSPATITLADISEEMPLHYIRNATATDGQRYFAIAGINQKQLFLFDKDLKPVLTWPQPADADKYEIAAVQLADLTGDGTPEIVVGYRVLAENSQRLAAIDLSGKTVWENRSVTEPDQIAIVLKNKVPHVWVVNRYTETNALVEFDAAGKKLREWQVDANGGLIWKLFATDLDGDGNSEVLAALLRDGEIVVAGINPDGRVGTDASQKPLLWEHAISPGPHGVKSFEFIVTGDINDDSFGEWCVAAADGTIYFFDKTGKLLDSFASGELLSGIAIIPGDNAVTLVLTTSKDRYDDSSAEDAVIALKVTQNATPQTTAMTPPPTTPATPDVPVASEAPELTHADQTGLLSVTGEAVESDETAEFGEINEAGEVTVPPEPAPASAPNAPLLPPLPRG
ncbi:MAG: thioredoxin family protein, partial [Planctomycetaceae bacterium]|nr:thioredoxin family protein [Planctomycetaceae bacterium]